jgi:hypothetical protein
MTGYIGKGHSNYPAQNASRNFLPLQRFSLLSSYCRRGDETWSAEMSAHDEVSAPLSFSFRSKHGHISLARRSRKLFATTLTELKAMAALARMGLSSNPKTGKSAPAATGIPMTL